ncbi:MAG: ferrous iron transport protein B [Chloroflexi bacterium]|jgi:ferrous iron transport protein B|nr:ferrous iron transport protein B [Chloroflexota bacterium]
MAITIAVAGNPNSGKTTLFNALTGLNQYVGNWPGVTVEKKEGWLKGYPDMRLVDLPGIYSLSANSLEEEIARDYLLTSNPDVIINIVDGTNLERNLYLTNQLAELDIPIVLAINMMDEVKKSGRRIDSKALGEQLGIPVVEISALRETQIDKLAKVAVESAEQKQNGQTLTSFSCGVENALSEIEKVALDDRVKTRKRWYAINLFVRNDLVKKDLNLTADQSAQIAEIIQKCELEYEDESYSIIASERYDFIELVLNNVYETKQVGELSTSDKIDRIVTNRWLALPIFALVMFLVYYISINTIGTMMTDWTNDVLFGEIILPGVGSLLEQWNVAAWLQGLLVDGILAGVGAVLGFLPQMIVLFLLLAIMEFSGYMARVAFIMDRLFRRFGLSGNSFIPMLIGSGCSVPAIMASRTIESEKDRRMTVITTSFIPCGAKLPVIAMIAGAFFGERAWVAFGSYFLGIAAVVVSGIILKKMPIFQGEPAPFVMELPAYRLPALKSVFTTTWDRASSFVKKAGSIILLATIAIWFLTYFGWVDGRFQMLASDQIDQSIMAVLGNAVAWIFAPLGWGEWRPVVAAITGLIAKETVVSSFGIFYGFAEVAESGQEIWTNLRAAFTPLSSVSFLIFVLLSAPCFAAIGAIKREMNSTKWTLFAVAYMNMLGYVSALIVYQLGMFLQGNPFTVGTAAAIAVMAIFLWLIFRPAPKPTTGSRLEQAEARV